MHGFEHGFRSVTLDLPLPLARGAFEAAMAELPPSVLRAKGPVRFEETPEATLLLQKVGKRWRLESTRRAIETGARLVFIGTPQMPGPEKLRSVLS